jgi:hypothetical protein
VQRPSESLRIKMMHDSSYLASQPKGSVKSQENGDSYSALLVSVFIVLIALIASVHVLMAYRQ